MHLYREQADALLRDLISEYSDCISDSSGIFLDLLSEDDWSFVIKSHAFLEAVVTESIVKQLDEQRVLRVVERLPLSNEEYGKLSIARDLDIIPKEQRTCIKKLSKLRNDIVHKPENINFCFGDYVQNLDKQQKRSWQDSIVWFKDSTNQWKGMALSKPKLTVWMSVFLIYTLLSVKNVELDSDRKLSSEEHKTTESITQRFFEMLEENA